MLAFAVVATASPTAQAAADVPDGFEPGPLTNLSESPNQQSIFPKVAQTQDSPSGAFHVAWREGADIKYRRVEEVGAVPDAPNTLSTELLGDSDDVDIAASGSYVYVVWMERRIREEVWLSASDDEGVTFGQPVRVSSLPGVTSWFPRVAALGKRVWIAWEEWEGGQHVALAHSDDGGVSFSPTEDLGSTGGSADLDVAVTGSRVHVAFRNDGGDPSRRGLFLRSGPLDGSLDPAVELSAAPRPFALDGSQDGVAIAWKDETGVKVGVREDSAAALSFQTLSADCSGDYDCLPYLEVWGSSAILAWVEKDGSERDITASRTEALSAGFRAPEHVADDATGLSAVHIADGRAYVGWHKALYRGGSLETFLAVRPPAGTAFTIYQVSDSPADDSFLPQLAVGERGVAVMWSEYSGQIGARYNPNLFEVLYQSVGFAPPDLRVVDVKLVQAPQDFPELVKGKQTAVRVVIDNSLVSRVTTEIDCSVETGTTPEVPCDGWARLDPGRNERYLRAPGAAAVAEETQVVVEVDPIDQVVETDNTNNSGTRTYPVRQTRPLRVLVVPLRVTGETGPSCNDVKAEAAEARDFVSGAFPVADADVRFTVSCAAAVQAPTGTLDEAGEVALLDLLDTGIAGAPYDYAIAMAPAGWFVNHTNENPPPAGIAIGQPVDSPIDSIIMEVGGGGVVAAHELTHSVGFEYLGQPHLQDVNAPGYWVRYSLSMSGLDWMHPSLADLPEGRWVSPIVYRQLLDRLEETVNLRAAQPERTFTLRGTIRDDGSLEARPIYALDAPPDVALDATGEIEVEYLDGSDAVIAKTAFDPSEGFLGQGGADGSLESIAVHVPEVAATQRLLVKRGAETLLDRVRTANAPEVQVASPNGGERLLVGDPVEVSWTASDDDGDQLRSIVSISTDDGQTWQNLGTDVEAESFTLTPTRDMVGDTALVRVTTTDGLNTTEDRSDATFSIESPRRNGRIALITTHFADESDENRPPDYEVATVEPDGSDIRRLTTRPQVESWPAWSPDGTEIAWVRETVCPVCDFSIWRMDADGGNQRQVTNPDPPAIDKHPDWSPDGTKIAFVRSTTTPACRSDLTVIDLASGDEDLLISSEAGPQGCNSLDHPAWSPDGQEIAYTQGSDAGLRIHKLRADGSQTIPDDLGPGLNPDWSPDGDQLVIIDNFRDLVVMQRNGSGRNPIATLGDEPSSAYNRPAWSPDGEKIAVGFQTLNPQRSDVQIMDVDGGNVENITENLLLPGGTTGFSGESQPSWQALPPVDDEPPPPPTADPGGPYDAGEGADVDLDASASEGSGLQFEWDLDGDGDFDDANGATATASFANEGTYTVAVRASDQRGLTDTGLAEVAVSNRPPLVGEVVSQVEGGQLERVAADFSDPGGQDRHRAEVDWGDGGPPEPAEVVETSDGGRVTASRPAAGPAGRTVTVRVFDDAGDADEGSAAIQAIPANGTPVVDDVSAQTSIGDRVEVEVPAVDPERDLLRVSLGSRPEHGEAVVLAGPLPVLAGARVAYTPEPGFTGTDSFEVTIADGLSSPATATVTIAVLPTLGGLPDGPFAPLGAGGATRQCADGRDNDGDRTIDRRDPGCLSRPDGSYNTTDDDESDEGLRELVLCGRRAISLIRADARKGKIVLRGLVSQRLEGRPIAIYVRYGRTHAGRLTRLATVRAKGGGEFTARVRRPPRRLFGRARYRAQVGRFHSVELKLPQSLESTSIRARGEAIELRGRVKRSVLGRRDPVVIKRLICGRYQTVGKARPDRRGRYVVRFPAPALAKAALYRAETRVLARPGSKRYVKQFARAIVVTLTGQSG